MSYIIGCICILICIYIIILLNEFGENIHINKYDKYKIYYNYKEKYYYVKYLKSYFFPIYIKYKYMDSVGFEDYTWELYKFDTFEEAKNTITDEYCEYLDYKKNKINKDKKVFEK